MNKSQQQLQVHALHSPDPYPFRFYTKEFIFICINAYKLNSVCISALLYKNPPQSSAPSYLACPFEALSLKVKTLCLLKLKPFVLRF
jgi:hypothetical protein